MRHLAITLCVFVSTLASSLVAVPAHVAIVPSAETTASGKLSDKGIERAGALAGYFDNVFTTIGDGPALAVFAGRPNPGTPITALIHTVKPTAQYFRQPIHSGYTAGQETQLADLILNDPRYDGINIVVCWPVNAIATLAQALGVPSPTPPPQRSDVLALITFSNPIGYVVVNQMLLFGDTQ